MSLYKHQQEVLQQTKDHNKVAYYLDMGLGKSFVGSFKSVSFEDPILIVCPKSLVYQWLQQFADNHQEWKTYNLTKKKQLEQFIFDDNNQRVGVINYESCWRRPELQKVKMSH